MLQPELNHPHHPATTGRDYEAYFPWKTHRKMRDVQREALALLPSGNRGVRIMELPTGSGKTALGMTFLKALAAEGKGPLFYITPTKAQVDQVKLLYPEVTAVYGRNEYDCLYYEPDLHFKADEIPCRLLTDCPHRVDQHTGENFAQNSHVADCPYLAQKYEAKQSPIIVCTAAFYLFTVLFTKEWGEPEGLVIDEAHKIADVFRNALSYEITDYHLRQLVDALRDVDGHVANKLERLLDTIVRIIKTKPANAQTMLEDAEIQEVIDRLELIQPTKDLVDRLKARIDRKVASGDLEREDGILTLRQMDTIVYSLGRYLRGLQFSLSDEAAGRNPLTYCFATYVKELDRAQKVQYRLIIRNYYVAPLIHKILAPLTLAMSATIGTPKIFSMETGINGPSHVFGSDFPHEKTRIFLPKDAVDLSKKAQLANRGGNILNKAIRRIATACRQFADQGLRSLVIVVSDAERKKFITFGTEAGLSVMSYSDGISARAAAKLFKEGEGHVLVGTTAQYAEGLDLPKGQAPIIFFLRPSYPPPDDPATIFEDRRFGSQRWMLWNWRVMIQALQVRGRNVRSKTDEGVTFFVSAQFGRFVAGSLPDWLSRAYHKDLSWSEAVQATIDLLK